MSFKKEKRKEKRKLKIEMCLWGGGGEELQI
jgi:hypothetical protein